MGDGTGYDDENDNERNEMREDENENERGEMKEDENEDVNADDENGGQYDGGYNDPNDPGMQDNAQHQQNRPKYNSA